MEQIPFLEGAREYAEDWLFPGGSCKNQRCDQDSAHCAPDASDEMPLLFFTPEPSGGLLIAVPPDRADLLAARFAEAGHFYALIGDVQAGRGIQVSL